MRKNIVYFKKKHFAIIFLIVFLFLISANLVFALEVKLPGLPEKPELKHYIGYIFTFVMGIAGAIALLSFILGAIRYMTAAGSPEAMSTGTDRMKGSIFGLVLLLVSYLIMQTINPQITKGTITQLGRLPGLYLVSQDQKERLPCPEVMFDTQPTLDAGFKTISYDCTEGLPLLIFKYPQKELEGTPLVETKRCGNTTNINSGSFTVAYETPGVYFYLTPCEPGNNFRSLATTSSMNEMDQIFNKKTKSIEIINDPDNGIYYGVVFHESIDFRGKCSNVLLSTSANRKCFPVNLDASSFTIFNWNPDWGNAGDGVTFYSQPHHEGGYAYIDDREMDPYYESGDLLLNVPEELHFDYRGTGIPEEEQDIYPNFQFYHPNSNGSIMITGNYLVVLYTTDGSCQVFTEDAVNLNVEAITKDGKVLKEVRIYPTK